MALDVVSQWRATGESLPVHFPSMTCEGIAGKQQDQVLVDPYTVFRRRSLGVVYHLVVLDKRDCPALAIRLVVQGQNFVGLEPGYTLARLVVVAAVLSANQHRLQGLIENSNERPAARAGHS